MVVNSLTMVMQLRTPIAKKQKLTALGKLLGPEQLSQESITLENELEKSLASPPVPRKENLIAT